MSTSRFFLGLTLAAALSMPLAAQAALTSQVDNTLTPRALSAADTLQTHQYRLPEARVAGQESVRQQVTVWEVTAGSWNGESLKGLSLVLVRSTPDNAQSRSLTSCYVSHSATAAQREALINAYLSSQALSPTDAASWRVEPAIIRFEIAGETVVIHLGLVA